MIHIIYEWNELETVKQQQKKRKRTKAIETRDIINFPSNTRPSKSNNVYQLVITNATLNVLQTLLHIYVTRNRIKG